MKAKRKNNYILLLLLCVLPLSTSCTAIQEFTAYEVNEKKETTEKESISPIRLESEEKVTMDLVITNPKSLFPYDENDYVVDALLDLLYEPLVFFTGENEAVPVIMEEYEQITDTEYILQIKENIYFHNEKKLTAEDVLYTFTYIKENQPSKYKWIETYIKSIDVIDTFVVQVEFYKKHYFNLHALEFPIISKEYVTSKEYSAMKPIGTGMYVIDEMQPMQYVHLLRNKKYHEKSALPYDVNAAIVRKEEQLLQMYTTKRSDILYQDITKWSAHSDDVTIKKYVYTSPYFYILGFNHEKEPMKKKEYRKFMASQMPYESINKDIFLRKLTDDIIPIQQGYYTPDIYNIADYNRIENPEKLLYEIIDGYVQYASYTLEILYVEEDYMQKKIAEYMQNAISHEIIQLRFTGLTRDEYRTRIENKEYDMFIGALKAEKVPYFEKYLVTEGKGNVFGYSHNLMDMYCSDIYTKDTENEVSIEINKINRLVYEELPFYPFGFLQNAVFQHNKLKITIKPSYEYIFGNIAPK